jgi:hypothetical protein
MIIHPEGPRFQQWEFGNVVLERQDDDPIPVVFGAET